MNKRIIISLLLASLTIGAGAQSKKSTTVKNESTPERTAEFPGGDEAMKNYLAENIKYPELAMKYDAEGSVTMCFNVDKDGCVKDVTYNDCKITDVNATALAKEAEAVQKDLKQLITTMFAEEAASVIREMPKWTPAMFGNKTVPTKYIVPIIYTIPDKNEVERNPAP
jgi:hypothetical protein